jgi:hypothetical protein
VVVVAAGFDVAGLNVVGWAPVGAALVAAEEKEEGVKLVLELALALKLPTEKQNPSKPVNVEYRPGFAVNRKSAQVSTAPSKLSGIQLPLV